MNFVAVADTHAALWYLYSDSRLSTAAKSTIDGALAGRERIAVSSISLVELVYLVEKQRVPPAAFHDLQAVLADPDHVFKVAALTAEIAHAMLGVSRDAIPDMPDRIVAATALHLSVPILSRDGRIRASNLHTVW